METKSISLNAGIQYEIKYVTFGVKLRPNEIDNLRFDDQMIDAARELSNEICFGLFNDPQYDTGCRAYSTSVEANPYSFLCEKPSLPSLASPHLYFQTENLAGDIYELSKDKFPNSKVVFGPPVNSLTVEQYDALFLTFRWQIAAADYETRREQLEEFWPFFDDEALRFIDVYVKSCLSK